MNTNKKNTKKDCIVCGKSSSAYKCPRCFMFYCSKDCCSTHKSTCSNDHSEETCRAPSVTNTAMTEHINSALELTDDTIPSVDLKEHVRILLSNHEIKDKEMEQTDPDFMLNLREDVFLLSDEDKERLRSNNKLQSLLKSKRLRKDLEIVDTANDRRTALRTLRSKNKEFNEVAEFIHDIVKKYV